MGRPTTINRQAETGKPLGHLSNPCEILSKMSPGTQQEFVADVLAAGTRQAAKAADLHQEGIVLLGSRHPHPTPINSQTRCHCRGDTQIWW